jgi:hypothetical protein
MAERKLYTLEQLKKKYVGKFVDVYPRHYDKWDEKTGHYVTVYEVRGCSSKVKENFQPVNEIGK